MSISTSVAMCPIAQEINIPIRKQNKIRRSLGSQMIFLLGSQVKMAIMSHCPVTRWEKECAPNRSS